MITSIETERAFEKIQHPFVIKVLNKLEEEKFLNLIKNTTKPMANTIPNVKRLNAFPPRSETRQMCPLLPLLVNVVLGKKLK